MGPRQSREKDETPDSGDVGDSGITTRQQSTRVGATNRSQETSFYGNVEEYT